ncbi:MAG: DNA alkylation repair protein [Candidatus Pacebacteria bacterium]|nr:DNA alkylation repair protein [Candidatus Paceibacterota bacterium]
MILVKELKRYASKDRKKINGYFFKTSKGEYGEGDIFMGVRVPDIRIVVKQNLDLNFVELQKYISSEFHEVRLCTILILVEKNKKVEKKERKKILKFYLKNLKYINNWDLVDLSAYYILGQAILDGLEKEKILDKLVVSKILWERRVGIIATWIFIRNKKINTVLRLSKKLLGDKEDLIHKAVGWMLREAWKKDVQKVEDFLCQNYSQLPRTTLRYAIERMEEKKRKQFLKGNELTKIIQSI